MNGWFGTRHMETFTSQRNFRTFVRESETASGTSRLWLLADEHVDSIDDSFFLVTMDDSRPFASYPGIRHRNSYSLGFFDGHSESWQLRDTSGKPSGPQTGGGVSRNNVDWIRLKGASTLPWGGQSQGSN